MRKIHVLLLTGMIVIFNSANSFSQETTPRIPVDKQLHLIAGAGISTISYFGVYKVTQNKKAAFWLSLSSGILAGIGKEILDAQGYGTPEVEDAVFTGAGAFASCLSIRIPLNRIDNRRKGNIYQGIAKLNMEGFVSASHPARTEGN